MQLHTFTVGPFEARCYLLIWEQGDAVVLDPGGGVRDIVSLARGSRVRYVLATHGHIDHVASAAEICLSTRASFCMHKADLTTIRQIPPEVGAAMAIQVWEPPAVGRLLDHGDLLEVGDKGIKVLHTPGHTPGSVCFVVGEHLFTGDTLFAGSVGRTDLPGGDWQTLQTTLRNRILPLPDNMVMHPGHGPDAVLGDEKRTNPFLQF